MSEPVSMTLAEARDALKAKKISSSGTDRRFRARRSSRRAALNAFVTETPERALAMAEASDARRAKGEGGALEGLPLAIKDLFCTKGVTHHRGQQDPGQFRAAL